MTRRPGRRKRPCRPSSTGTASTCRTSSGGRSSCRSEASSVLAACHPRAGNYRFSMSAYCGVTTVFTALHHVMRTLKFYSFQLRLRKILQSGGLPLSSLEEFWWTLDQKQCPWRTFDQINVLEGLLTQKVLLTKKCSWKNFVQKMSLCMNFERP